VPVSPADVLDSFFQGYEATVGVIEPGDIVFIPEGWWHPVESQSASITLSGNWGEQSNREAFFQSHFLDQPEIPEGVPGVLQNLKLSVADAYRAGGGRGFGVGA
jgi:hypothetical protein